MFILFDSSLSENLESQDIQYKNELMVLLRESTNAIYHKNHYVSTVRSAVAQTFARFSRERQENTIANAFDYIYRNYSILNSIINYLNYVVIIGKYEKEWEFEDKKLKIHYKYALSQHFWDETFLIPENIDDDRYIKTIVDYEKSKRSTFNNISYKYRGEQGGGGKNIKQVFNTRLEEHAFVLAFLDTDKKAPCDKFGATANFFETDTNLVKYKKIFYYIPDVHEIENLFSSSGFMELSKYSQRTRNKINEIERKSLPNANLFRAFLDIKKGYTYAKVSNNDYLNHLLELDYSSVNCSYGNCPCANKKCDKIAFDGASPSYLSDVFSNSSFSDNLNSSVEMLIPEIKKEWENIFLIFITACCCNSDKITGVN